MLIESDGFSSKSAGIRVEFGLFLSDSESYCFLSDLNRIILPQIGSDLYQIRTMLSNETETFESVIICPTESIFQRLLGRQVAP